LAVVIISLIVIVDIVLDQLFNQHTACPAQHNLAASINQ